MIRRDILSWWFRPRFLQPWGRPANTLFAGPWLGEFGWELLNWQPFLRYLAPRYRRVIVSCRDGMQALYDDFATEFVVHDVKGTAECNVALRVENPDELARVRTLVPSDADYLPTVGWQPIGRKRFRRFGSRLESPPVDVLFHPRGRTFGGDRNWPSAKWNSLIQRLHERDLRLGCIGLSNATLDVQGPFVDFRDLPLEKTMDLLASSRLVLGPSSGPMHLASLCGTPHLVWTDTAKYARGRTNRAKYEHWWNPLGTRVRVLDEEGFDPSVELVLRHTAEVLALSRHTEP